MKLHLKSSGKNDIPSLIRETVVLILFCEVVTIISLITDKISQDIFVFFLPKY